MARKRLDLNPPYREIGYADGKKEFWNRLAPKNRIDMSCLVGMNAGSRYVVVYEVGGKIFGFMAFLDKGNHLHLDLVERNESVAGSRGAGFNLMMLLEIIAGNFGYSRITLYSVRENIGYYRNLGYENAGPSHDDPNYGRLTPMAKCL